ncbi:hypothetical protein LQW54_009861 [Pestalotiopsis sp. IQ-011]
MERVRGVRARARYQVDREAAVRSIIPNVSSISPNDGDGEFTFTYTSSLLGSHTGTRSSATAVSKLKIRVIPQEFSGYPRDHFFIVFADDQNVSPAVATVLDDFMAQSVGMKVRDALTTLSQRITASLTPRPARNGTGKDATAAKTADLQSLDNHQHDDSDSEEFNFNDADLDDEVFDDASLDDEVFGLDNSKHLMTREDVGDKLSTEAVTRVIRDFQAVRRGGFFISKMYGFESHTLHHIVSISVRVDELCLSQEVLSAWNLQSTEFIVLLIKYHQRYTTFEQALRMRAPESSMEFRLRKCTQYKTSLHQVCKSFGAGRDVSSATLSHDDKAPTLDQLGVGDSVNNFMKREFICLLKLRYEENLTWDDAKEEYEEARAFQHCNMEKPQSRKSVPSFEKASTEDKLPAFVAQDHVTTDGEKSLPLIAMQFALRHFLRCTDYCMVCFKKLRDSSDALKPYVCSTPVCLFQYMNVGLGPSIDLEVLNHPNVVDLLISFCWAALGRADFNSSGLREFPNGLSLRFPKLADASLFSPDSDIGDSQSGVPNVPKSVPGSQVDGACSGTIDKHSSVFTLDNPADGKKFREGDWVVIVVHYHKRPGPVQPVVYPTRIFQHGRVFTVSEKDIFLEIYTRHTLPISNPIDSQVAYEPEHDMRARIVPYDQDFDDLVGEQAKRDAILLLLATTPPVRAMRNHLKEWPQNRLEKWNRLSPSVSKLIRWIVASNRSSIVQVDQLRAAGNEDESKDEASLARHDERITGMNGWLQFRFAQGSPEKEVQFRKEVAAVRDGPKTILAWHGSSLGNWHSIIRNGLDFKTIANGRAFGHGVYFAADFSYSLSYTNRTYSTVSMPIARTSLAIHRTNDHALCWPNSRLQVNSAMSLNEIVNKPSQFVHGADGKGIYVVDKVTWIQCRYLFVRPGDANILAEESQTQDQEAQGPWVVQDTKYVALGPERNQIQVPKVAIPSAREGDTKDMATTKANATGHAMADGIEDPEDIEFLFGDSEGISCTQDQNSTAATESTNGPGLILQTDKTDFKPATLDLSTLPRLAPPVYATAHAQRTISQEIKKLQEVQATTPLHELGWFIDFENMSNMFHWIVELHSLDPSLPLAEDMKKAGMTSIVLEIRFGRNYPLSPPFLRVVRPRFLPFLDGGGGHVTAGGAMCMELLTNTGWSPANSMESVLVQVRLALCSQEPRPARLAKKNGQRADYGISEAYSAFLRAASTHGWEVPGDLKEATMAV